MFSELPDTFTMELLAAFALGWIVAKLGSYISGRLRAGNRDPRDTRIRSLEADVRVAHTAAGKSQTRLDEINTELTQARKTLQGRDAALAKLEQTVEQLREDLKNSVKKTRELREELTLRATESVRSEVKLREVETELSLVHASTDLLASGMMEYLHPEADEDDVQMFKAGG